MNRKTIIAFASSVAIATTAALAQDTRAPDFSPMQPRLGAQSSTLGTYDGMSSASDASPITTQRDNRMLQGYQSSDLLPGERAAAPVADEYTPDAVVVAPRTATVRPAAPSQSFIGNGLFNRRGPNDFGA